jgi:hypothetical protein
MRMLAMMWQGRDAELERLATEALRPTIAA